MKHNMGRAERVIRAVFGFALFFMGWAVMFGFQTWIASPAGAATVGLLLVIGGTVLLLTSLFAYCPINALVAHNSCQACKIGETHRHMPV